MDAFKVCVILPDGSQEVRRTRNWRPGATEKVPRPTNWYEVFWTCLSVLTLSELAQVRDGQIYVLDSIGRIIRPEDIIDPQMTLRLVPGNQDDEETKVIARLIADHEALTTFP